MRRPVEETKPEKAAVAIDAATDPFTSIREVAKRAGLPNTTTQQLIKRLETRYQPLNTELKTLKHNELLAMIEDRLHRALQYLDDFVLAGSSARDLAVIAGVLFDKRQLLNSQPTTIHSYAEIKTIEEHGKLLMEELNRRGVVVETDFTVVDPQKDTTSDRALPHPVN